MHGVSSVAETGVNSRPPNRKMPCLPTDPVGRTSSPSLSLQPAPESCVPLPRGIPAFRNVNRAGLDSCLLWNLVQILLVKFTNWGANAYQKFS